MPRKEFEAFTRLDASDVNTFLMDQSVMSFAGTAARGSAIPTPVQGMTTYLEDSESYESYNSSAWVPMLSTGAWTAFTPTWVSGLTVGNGVYNTSHYVLNGKTVTFAIDFTLGSTSAVTGAFAVDLPAAINRKNLLATGSLYLRFQTAGGGMYLGDPFTTNAALNRFFCRYAASTAASAPIQGLPASSTTPFTWATNDRITFAGTYEVA